MLYAIIEVPIHFILIAGLLYIYNVIQHLLQRLQVIRMPPHPDICPLGPRARVDLLGVGGGSLLVLMIEVPHPLHTHSRSALYIYKAVQLLL
jgi:hypothetical protein